MQSIKKLHLLALVALFALVAAACGPSDPGAPSEDPTVPPVDETTAPPAEPTETAAPLGDADGTLHLGTILPETGSLAFLGPPEFAAVEMAVNDINDAGGVLGNDVELSQGDSGDTTTELASQTVDKHLTAGADAIVGAASSGVSFTVIDKITGAGKVHFSPANTSPDFTDYNDNGLYFRTAPSDVLQGRTLGEIIIEDQHSSVGILALQDPYGEGLADNVELSVVDSGGEVPEKIIYNPTAKNFDAEVQQIKAADPDAIVLIGFDESAKVITEMIEQGVGPQDKPLYLVDGNTGNALGEQIKQEGALDGVKGTIPGAEQTPAFKERLDEVDPKLKDYSYAPESYDAVVVIALAAVAANSDAGTAVGAQIPGVTREGTKCTEFKECADLLASGEDIDYDGVSGPIEMDDAGDPTEASIGVYTFGPDNQLLPDVEYRFGKV